MHKLDSYIYDFRLISKKANVCLGFNGRLSMSVQLKIISVRVASPTGEGCHLPFVIGKSFQYLYAFDLLT